MNLGQYCFHAIRPLEIWGDRTRNSPIAVCSGCVLSGPLLSLKGLPSHCFKRSFEDNSFFEQVNNWYEFEFYGNYKAADSHSASDRQAQKTTELTLLHDGTRYFVGMLWVNKDVSLPNNYYSLFAHFILL